MVHCLIYEMVTPLQLDNRSVLLVGNFLSGSTPNRFNCEDLADRLEDSGWTVLRTSSRPGRLARLFDILGTIWFQRHRFQVARVDVYSGFAFALAEAACWALRRVGRPYVLVLQGGELFEFTSTRKARARRLFGSAAAVVTPASSLARALSDLRSDISVVPNGVDLPDSGPNRTRVNPQPKIVWVRSFHRIYQPVLVPRVVHLLQREHPTTTVIMVGGDKGDGALQATRNEAQKYGVESQIQWVGGVHKSEVAGFLEAGDLFLNTTSAESFGLGMMEAASLGLCLVSTNAGELPFIWSHERDALLVDVGDFAGMASAISRILSEPGLAQQLSANALSTARRYSWAKVLPLWEEVLESVANGVRRS